MRCQPCNRENKGKNIIRILCNLWQSTLMALFKETIKLIGFTHESIKALKYIQAFQHTQVALLKLYLSDFWLSALVILTYYYVLKPRSINFIKTQPLQLSIPHCALPDPTTQNLVLCPSYSYY